MKKILTILTLLMTQVSMSTPIVYTPEGTLEFAKSIIKKYPEVEWLLDDKVEYSQQGKGENLKTSFSKAIKDRHHPEFERTILSILVLHALYEGSDTCYEWLTACQKVDRLKQSNFNQLHKFTKKVVQKYGMNACEVALILGDLGKTKTAKNIAETAQKLAKDDSVIEHDHDRWLSACLSKYPEIFLSYQKLSESDQKIVSSQIGLIHLGHLKHMEAGPILFKNLKELDILKKGDELDFCILDNICDSAAAWGQDENQGSLILTEKAYIIMKMAGEAIRDLARKDVQEVFKKYIDRWATQLNLSLDFRASNKMSSFIRIAANLRLVYPSEGTDLVAAWDNLDPSIKSSIDEEFDLFKPVKGQTPTYVPAVLTNMYRKLTEQNSNSVTNLTHVLKTALPFILHVIKKYQDSLEFNENTTLNFNKIGGSVRDNPSVLDNNPSYTIKNGNIKLAK